MARFIVHALWRAARPNLSFSPNGRPTASCISSAKPAVGGTSTAGRTGRSKRSIRWRPNLANRNGNSAFPPMISSHRRKFSAPIHKMELGIWQNSELGLDEVIVLPEGGEPKPDEIK